MDMWDVTVPVIGRCRECGEELATAITVRATAQWVERYQHEAQLRGSVDRAIVRLVLARHSRHCPRTARRPLALAATA